MTREALSTSPETSRAETNRASFCPRFLALALACVAIAVAAAPTGGDAAAQRAYDPYASEDPQQSAQNEGQANARRQNAGARRAPSSRRARQGSGRAQQRRGAGGAAPGMVGARPGGRGNFLSGLGAAAATIFQTGEDAWQYYQQIDKFANELGISEETLGLMRQARERLPDKFTKNLDNVWAGIAQINNQMGGSGINLADGIDSLQSNFQEDFPVVTDAADLAMHPDSPVNKSLQDNFKSMQTLSKHTDQLRKAQDDLRRFSNQLKNADTPQKVRELGASLQHYQVNEMQMIRQMLVQQQKAQTRWNSEKQAREKRKRHKFRAMMINNSGGDASERYGEREGSSYSGTDTGTSEENVFGGGGYERSGDRQSNEEFFMDEDGNGVPDRFDNLDDSDYRLQGTGVGGEGDGGSGEESPEAPPEPEEPNRAEDGSDRDRNTPTQTSGPDSGGFSYDEN